MKAAIAIYLVAGLTTAMSVREVHYQTCTMRTVGEYVLVAAIWPIGGAYMLFADHAKSRCAP